MTRLTHLTRRIAALAVQLETGLVERRLAVRLVLLAALAGEHSLLIGPPGTAKSALARRLHAAFSGARYFERLLTRFSVPEELFGPLSISALEQDRYERHVEGFLPVVTGNGKTPIDFRAQAGVYVLYDGADIPSSRVTYVGQVGRSNGGSLYARLYDHHAKDHLWNRWTRFSWFGVFAIGKSGLTQTKVAKTYADTLGSVIDHLEGVLITVLEPPLNKRGANWDGATQCFQYLPDVPDPIAARLDALTNQIATLQGRLKGE